MKKGIIITLRKNYWFRFFSPVLAILFLLQNFIPAASYALTSGPSAPEANGFTPVEQQQLVDPFTGDFSYNIPLLNVGDYPLNISYSSAGVNMETEASWVGLGWNLNVGVINRTMRGLPDDFNGDPVKREFNMKDNVTVGGTVSQDMLKDVELSGFEIGKKISVLLEGKKTVGKGIEIKYNNYTGISIGQSLSVNFSGAATSKLTEALGLGLGMSGGLSLMTGEDGLTVAPNISFSYFLKAKDKKGEWINGDGYHSAFGLQFNSRSGLKARTLSLVPNFANQTKLFGPVSFTPRFEFPFSSSAATFSFKLGGKIFPAEMSATAAGSFSKQTLFVKELSRPSYGYIYLENGQQDEHAQLDFNREKDASFMPGTPHLPPAYLTYDIFSVGAQGIGGTYRAYRNEAGFVFDSRVDNGSSSGSVGLEANTGNSFKGGVDQTIVDVSSHTSVWKNSNNAWTKLQYQKPATNDVVRNVYFKKIGEISHTVSNAFYHAINDNNPVRNPISGSSKDLELALESEFADENGATNDVSQPLHKMNDPLLQKESMQILKVGDVNRAGLYQKKYILPNAKPHHIGQIIINADDGKRFIFGLPAYNNIQKEVSFNVDAPATADKNNPFVSYSPGIDNSVKNKKGISHFYEATTIPPFSYAFYLTDVLSTDYSDMSGNGPTPDDYGTYTRFHYTNCIPSFKWRTPYVNTGISQYDPGLQSVDDDDKGNYIYGTRDVWYLDSVETKNEIAVFHTSKRDDAYEAYSENGGIGSNSLLKLDSISLYNIHDRIQLGSGATPLKRVHFIYDYSLCTGIPNGINATTGKLTLKKIYFTYNDSYEGRREKYEFGYSSENPSYNIQSTDNWGTYKPEFSSGLSNRDFPYTNQDKSTTNNYASAWLLTHIQLPSGGYYDVQYESDDYNYVQDKRTMKLIPVNTVAEDTVNIDWSKNELENPGNSHFYFIFSLDKNNTDPIKAKNYVKSMLGNLEDPDGIAKNLYFNFKVNMDGFDGIIKSDPKYFDRIYGFCELDTGRCFGVIEKSGKYLGWVKVKPVKTDRDVSLNCNPVSKAAFHFCRINTPRYAFDEVTLNDLETDPVGSIKSLWAKPSIINQLVEFIEGPNQSLRTKGIGQQFKPGESFIRLLCPDKLGGGARVKQVTAHNAWDTMKPGEDVLNFTDEYHYTDEDEVTSSGVATYEPFTGGEENPFHLPVTYTPETGQKRMVRMLIPDEQYLLFKPYGEMAFPSPAVGYSRVTVQRKVPENSSVAGTGYTEFSYYTARDYPVVSTHTPIQTERRKKKPFFSLFNKKIYDYVTASQGYSIVVNDMHGKLRSSTVRDAYERVISQTENKYLLGEEINVLNNGGNISDDNLGREIDFVSDFREEETSVESSAMHVNAGTFIWPWPPTPIFIVLPIPVFEKEYTRFRSATATKVIYNYAILNQQTVTDLGSSITTKNIIYDPVTSNPVLTVQNNAFGDEKYFFSYPARMIYPGMDAASQNNGLRCTLITDGSGKISSPPSLIFPGDEVLSLSGNTYGWVYKHIDGDYYLMDKNGNALENKSGDFLIVRSGHRNLLDAGAGTVVTLQNPLTKISSNPDKFIMDFNPEKQILDAQSTTYRDYWYKPVRKVINKGILPGASYGLKPETDETEVVHSCKCVDNDITFCWESFFKELISSQNLTSVTPVKLTQTSCGTVYWAISALTPNTIDGKILTGITYIDPTISPALLQQVFNAASKNCFTLNDKGNDSFNCIAVFLSDNFTQSFSVYINPDGCDPMSFELILYRSTPGMYRYQTYKSHSCFNMFDCTDIITACNHESSLLLQQECTCGLNNYGIFWKNYFSKWVNTGDFFSASNEVILNIIDGGTNGGNIDTGITSVGDLNPADSLTSTVVISSVGGVGVSTTWDNPPVIVNANNPDSTVTTFGVNVVYWNPGLPNDTLMYVCASVNDSTPDTCFVFKDPANSSFTLIKDFVQEEKGNLEIMLSHDGDCKDDTSFTMEVILHFPEGDKVAWITGTSLCGPLFKCTPSPKDMTMKKQCVCPQDSIVNPYFRDILGNWRKYEEYKYLIHRFPEFTSSPVNLRSDGYYRNFNPFWKYTAPAWQPDTANWTLAERITIYDFNGNGMESKDALGNYSNALFGYNLQLRTAECINSEAKEAGFDGFEDYYPGLPGAVFYGTNPCFNTHHLKFEDYAHKVTAMKAHTGLYSLRCNNEVSFTTNITPPLCDVKSPGTLSGCPCFPTQAQFPWVIRTCDRIPLFSPDSLNKDKTFILSFWMLGEKLQSSPPFKLDVGIEKVKPVGIQVITTNYSLASFSDFSPLAVQLIAVSNPVENWRQYNYRFTILANSTGKFRVRWSGIHNEIFLDDFRIHPVDATMKAYVYDPFTNRLSAVLDENNYAVFYQYDAKGNLQIERRETERGIMGVSYNADGIIIK